MNCIGGISSSINAFQYSSTRPRRRASPIVLVVVLVLVLGGFIGLPRRERLLIEDDDEHEYEEDEYEFVVILILVLDNVLSSFLSNFR